MPLRNLNSLDYLCPGSRPLGWLKPSLSVSVVKRNRTARETGICTQILAFHELSTTATMLPDLVKELKAGGTASSRFSSRCS